MAGNKRRPTERTRSGRRRRKSRNRNRSRNLFIVTVVIMMLVALAVTGITLLIKYHTYKDYSTDAVIEMSNSEENTRFYSYGDGYIKCAGDGITCFSGNKVLWSENYSMTQPAADICGDYIAVADITQRNVYLYDRSGYVNRINIGQNIMDIEVTQTGMIAVAANDGNVNYIELKDKKGDEIMTAKSVFSSSGYLMDLALSDDGSKMAAVYVSVERGTLKSKIIFYDLSGDGSNDDLIAATFDQYESVLMTNVQFLGNDRVCAVGDTAITLYSFTDKPEIIWEKTECSWQIQSLMFDDKNIGLVVEEPESEYTYVIKVIDSYGNTVMEKGTDFSYFRVQFAGSNVFMYSGNELLVYSFAGVEKFHKALDEHIEGLASSDGRHFIYGTGTDTRFISLR